MDFDVGQGVWYMMSDGKYNRLTVGYGLVILVFIFLFCFLFFF